MTAPGRLEYIADRFSNRSFTALAELRTIMEFPRASRWMMSDSNDWWSISRPWKVIIATHCIADTSLNMQAREILPWAYQTGSPLLEAFWGLEEEVDGSFDVLEPHKTEAQ